MDEIPEDIERMARYLGWEDPAIRRLLRAYIRSSKMREAVRNILKRRCVQAGFNPDDPPTFLPVRDLPPGLLQVGQVKQGSMPGPYFALPEEIIGQHVGIFGHNGTGKSYLAMHLILQAMRAGLRTWIFGMVKISQIPGNIICGSIQCGSLKSEGFGDGCTALGALPSPSCA